MPDETYSLESIEGPPDERTVEGRTILALVAAVRAAREYRVTLQRMEVALRSDPDRGLVGFEKVEGMVKSLDRALARFTE